MRLEPNRAPIGRQPGPQPSSSARRLLTRRARVCVGLGVIVGGALGLACGDAGMARSAAELGQASLPIIGGSLDEATTGVVGLALDVGTRAAGHCSGTLIAPNLVLTARHCVAFTEDADSDGIVQCDSAEFTKSFPADMLLASAELVRPRSPDDPSYVRGREVRTLGDSQVCGSDVALVILERAAPAAAVPITPRLSVPPADHEPFSTLGYGLTSVDDPNSDGRRQRADGSSVRCSGEACVALSDGSIRSSEWASVDAPICSGDSGGPALDEQGRVFGVASRGDPACQVAVFGDISNWAPFIIDTALDAAEAGGYRAPDWALEGGDAESAGGCSLAAAPSRTMRRGLSLTTMLFCTTWMMRRALRSRRAAARC